jgi:hypothetical protein
MIWFNKVHDLVIADWGSSVVIDAVVVDMRHPTTKTGGM